jgi:dihydrofolate reductase
MIVSLIAAATENRVIGKNGDMPWNMPDDLTYFMHTTRGHHVIMGRRTFEANSISKPLPDRTNIIITSNKDYSASGAIVVAGMDEALDIARKNKEKEAFVIGGEQIFRLALPFADRIYLTLIHTRLEGDTFFPETDKNVWKTIKTSPRKKDAQHKYDFTFYIYERITD